MQMQEALVIVDMQRRFGGAKGVIKPVVKEIRRAFRVGSHFIIVEYVPNVNKDEQTYKCLTDLIGDCEQRCLVAKGCNDGSSKIEDELNERKWFFEKFRVVGVNYGACVRATATGLARRFPTSQVEVIRKASNPTGRRNYETFEEKDNLGVIRR